MRIKKSGLSGALPFHRQWLSATDLSKVFYIEHVKTVKTFRA